MGRRGGGIPPALVREIRNEYATGKYTQTQLAKKYQLTQGAISKIVSGVSGASLGGPITKKKPRKPK